MAEEQT